MPAYAGKQLFLPKKKFTTPAQRLIKELNSVHFRPSGNFLTLIGCPSSAALPIYRPSGPFPDLTGQNIIFKLIKSIT